MVDRRNMPLEDLISSQFQSEEEFTNQRSFHTVYSSKFQITVEKNLTQALTFRLAQSRLSSSSVT